MLKRVGIIGCGLIGHKRAAALGEHTLVIAADVNAERARALAARHPGCLATTDWTEVVGRSDVDLLVIATTNDLLAPISLEAVRRGKHVLVEKPAARSASELEPVLQAARAYNCCVKVGFNKRFHPAFLKARALVDEGALGPLLYVRGRYGHGGRVGYDREWRAVPAIAGGGELLDQGVHLIDLARWFLGDFPSVAGHVATWFWDMPVEDNAFLSLRTAAGQTAWLHASCTEWKNLFCFEIFGRQGKLQIDGLGGSYGVERLTFYHMLPEMGPPETTSWEYPGEDRSWAREVAHLVTAIDQGTPLSGSLEDAFAALDIAGQVYAASAQPQKTHGLSPASESPRVRRSA